MRPGFVLSALLAAACSDPEGPPAAATAAFPANYAESYVEVRGCRKGADHELAFVRVLADPSALDTYSARDGEFAEGAVLLKEQYEAADAACSGPIAEWTVMRKNPAATDSLGWDWQRVGADRRVASASSSSCSGCHTLCTGAPKSGYDFTCTDP